MLALGADAIQREVLVVVTTHGGLEALDEVRWSLSSACWPGAISVLAYAGASVARPAVVELRAELTKLRERIGQYPEHLVDQLHAAHSARDQAQRVADSAAHV